MTISTARRPRLIAILGLTGEAGECADKIKKRIRGDDYDMAEWRKAFALELGDVLVYLSILAYHHGFLLSEIMRMSQEKLEDRKARGTKRGEGDDR